MARRESHRNTFILIAFLFFGLILVNNVCKVREGHNVVNEKGEVLYTQTISLKEVQRAAAESADMAQNAANNAVSQADSVERAASAMQTQNGVVQKSPLVSVTNAAVGAEARARNAAAAAEAQARAKNNTTSQGGVMNSLSQQ